MLTRCGPFMTATITGSTRQVARELEREFGHNRVQGAHVERDGPEGDRHAPAAAHLLTR